jgi:hypothetical protein
MLDNHLLDLKRESKKEREIIQNNTGRWMEFENKFKTRRKRWFGRGESMLRKLFL